MNRAFSHRVLGAALAAIVTTALAAPSFAQGSDGSGGSGGSTGSTHRSAKSASKRTTAARKSSTAARAKQDSATATASGASAATPPASSAATKDSVKSGKITVNKYMSYDPAKKTITLQVNAAEGSVNGGMNFNGGARGDQTITVPQGWTVHLNFLNKDAIPHSAIVIPNTQPLPAIPQEPALAGAYTRDVTAGIPTDGTDQTTFKASKPGSYLLACGVPGHAPSGMYVNFVVSPDATAPSYKM